MSGIFEMLSRALGKKHVPEVVQQKVEPKNDQLIGGITPADYSDDIAIIDVPEIPEIKPEVQKEKNPITYTKYTRICKKCQVEKPLSEFPKDTHGVDGFRVVCSACLGEKRKENKPSVVSTSKQPMPIIKKKCEKCHEEKATNEFGKNQTWCKACNKKYQSEIVSKRMSEYWASHKKEKVITKKSMPITTVKIEQKPTPCIIESTNNHKINEAECKRLFFSGKAQRADLAAKYGVSIDEINKTLGYDVTSDKTRKALNMLFNGNAPAQVANTTGLPLVDILKYKDEIDAAKTNNKTNESPVGLNALFDNKNKERGANA